MASSHQETARLVKTLLREFKAYYDAPPPWAWPYVPSIPFVGETYTPGKGLLIYASAENFAWMHRGKVPARYRDGRSWNRYRAAYDEQGRLSGDYFPCVGIQPFNDGGLFAAALFTAERCGLPVAESPRVFVETLAFTNFAKFTIKRQTNQDYISDRSKLASSLVFILSELTLLRPAIVLLPEKVMAHRLLAETLRGVLPSTRFLGLPQFNATVVNCHLGNLARRSKALSRGMRETPLAAWMENLVGINPAMAWRYIARLDAALRSDAR